MSMSLCNPCSKRYKTESAVMLCEDCNEGFCARCLNVHKSNPEFFLHLITEIGCLRGCEFAGTKLTRSADNEPIILPAIKNFQYINTIHVQHDKNVYISSLALTEDNRLLLCNTRSRNVLVYSENGDHLLDCLLFGEPWDIAIIPGGKKAVVTLDSVPAIQFIDLYPIQPGRTLSLQNKCYGITIIKNYLCLGGRSVIYILDNAGQSVRTINIDQVGFIWYLHPGPPDIIYYTSFDCNEVGCVGLDGSTCFKYKSSQHGRSDIDDMNKERTKVQPSNEKVLQTINKDEITRGPEAIVTDKDGYVYVACRESNVICRLTPVGNFQSNVLTTTDKIKRPYGIAFNENCTKLFLSNNDGELVTIFSCQ